MIASSLMPLRCDSSLTFPCGWMRCALALPAARIGDSLCDKCRQQHLSHRYIRISSCVRKRLCHLPMIYRKLSYDDFCSCSQGTVASRRLTVLRWVSNRQLNFTLAIVESYHSTVVVHGVMPMHCNLQPRKQRTEQGHLYPSPRLTRAPRWQIRRPIFLPPWHRSPNDARNWDMSRQRRTEQTA